MALLGVAAFALIHQAAVMSGSGYGTTGASFACRLCVLPRGTALSGIGGERAELTTRRLLIFAPGFDLEALGDVQLEVRDEDDAVVEQTGDRWNRDGKVETVNGPDGSPEYRRCEVLRVDP